jgi:hypothetical protein
MVLCLWAQYPVPSRDEELGIMDNGLVSGGQSNPPQCGEVSPSRSYRDGGQSVFKSVSEAFGGDTNAVQKRYKSVGRRYKSEHYEEF